VLEQACRQVVAWQEGRPAGEPLLVSVNLSPRQFQQPSLADDVAQTLRATGLPAHCLKLELTETALMRDLEAATATLGRLKALGVQLAVDDFGTGYSSLNYLKRFPVDTLKIDRSFVQGLGEDAHDSAIVSNVIGLANSLGLQVTGEGIETAEQLRYLSELGCDTGQGYYLARPLPADAVAALIAAARPLPATEVSEESSAA
jgi:EAL domain-containing protein (putative c-di-GMP-specific phosphodiesterase class I)